MVPMDSVLARLALSPATCVSADRLPSSYTATCTRATRIMNLSLLRTGSPPGSGAQRRCLAWVMSDSEEILAGVLYAAVMVQRRVMTKRMVSGPVRERLVSILGAERLADALRYQGEEVTAPMDACGLEELRVIGYAVMYRYLRTECVELARRLLRSMYRDDPCLDRSIPWIRRMQRHSCVPIGTKVVSWV
jgi:hypothetical protein